MLKKFLFIYAIIGLCRLGIAQPYTLSVEPYRQDTSSFFHTLSYQTSFSDTASRYQELNKLLLNLYDQGYLEASFDSIYKDSLHLKGFLYPGGKYEWLSLRAGAVGKALFTALDIDTAYFNGKVFQYKELNGLLEKIIRHYENNGYPFATVDLEDIRIREKKLSARLHIEKNDFIRIDSVVTKGYSKTPKNFIRYHLGLKPGMAYSEQQVQQLMSKGGSIEFLTMARAPQVSFTKKNTSLYLYLEEKKANRFNGIIGINTDEDGEVRLNGELYLRLLNSIKKGEELVFSWKRPDENIQTLDIRFQYPFIWNTPVWLSTDFSMFRQDSSFLNLSITGGLEYMLRPGNFLQFHIQRKYSDILLKRENLPSGLNAYSTLYYKIGFRALQLDDWAVPRNGYQLEASVGSGDRESDGARQRQYLYELQLYYYHLLGNRNVLAPVLRSGGIFSDLLFQNELYRIGGLKTLRGFNEKSIFASFYTSATLEYRYLTDRYSYLFAFADGAYVENGVADVNTDLLLIGLGAGISFKTRAGTFSLSYAMGKQEGAGFDFRTAKVHFGFVNQF